MQEEVNEKTISLCVQCSRMTASVLKAVMRKSLNDLDRKKQKHDQVRQQQHAAVILCDDVRCFFQIALFFLVCISQVSENRAHS